MSLAGALLSESCTVVDKADYTFEDARGGGGQGGSNPQGGTAGGLQCGPNQVVCGVDCIDADECCTSDDCAAGETCVNHDCQACTETCPAPTSGTGAGVCENGECVIVCDGDQEPCGSDCVDLTQNGDNCGACGNACTEGLVCDDGACSDECAEGLAPCGASCVDLQADVDHCGDCETSCHRPAADGTATCESGECGIACSSGFDPCDGECVDFSSDEENCGACGAECAGACLEGVCCLTGQSNCDGGCFDVLTSPLHCGACGADCAEGEVCNEGRCSTDCGSLALCGNECVDVVRNPNHCQRCGNQCLPPASNGAAICTGAAGCDIQCNQGSQRCGNTCCAPAPPNASVSCGQNNACQVQCAANYHACSGTASPCYPNSDVQHCGESCLDCRQPNATVLCNGSRCANICDGPVTFPCNDPSGKVACGSWGFESRTNEGWQVDPAGPSSAWTGTLGATTARAYAGSASLAFGFDGNGETSGTNSRYIVDLFVTPCPSGAPINWPPRRFSFAYYIEPAQGSPVPVGAAEVYWILRNGNQHVLGTCDTVLDFGQWRFANCQFQDSTLVATRVSLIFRVFAPFRGTFYLDAIDIQ